MYMYRRQKVGERLHTVIQQHVLHSSYKALIGLYFRHPKC